MLPIIKKYSKFKNLDYSTTLYYIVLFSNTLVLFSTI